MKRIAAIRHAIPSNYIDCSLLDGLYANILPESLAARQEDARLNSGLDPHEPDGLNAKHNDLERLAAITPGEFHKLANAGKYKIGTQGSISAQLTANYLSQLDFFPDVIVASPLRRARQTAATIYGTLADLQERETPVVFFEHPYLRSTRNDEKETGSDLLLGILRALDEEYKNILIVGHDFHPKGLAVKLGVLDKEGTAHFAGGYFLAADHKWKDLSKADIGKSYEISPRRMYKNIIEITAGIAEKLKWRERGNFNADIADKLKAAANIFDENSEMDILPQMFSHRNYNPAPVRYIAMAAQYLAELNNLSAKDLARQVKDEDTRNKIRVISESAEWRYLLAYLEVQDKLPEVIKATVKTRGIVLDD